jgi:hypothetical protein
MLRSAFSRLESGSYTAQRELLDGVKYSFTATRRTLPPATFDKRSDFWERILASTVLVSLESTLGFVGECGD